jgi:hypothetical protein
VAVVAVGAALIGAFGGAGADERGRFGVDQFWVKGFGRDPDSVGHVGEFELRQKVEQGRLVHRHRVLCSYFEELHTVLTDHRTVVLHVASSDTQEAEITPLRGRHP